MNSRVRASDLLSLATVGMRSRPLRAALSTLGIAIGIAAIVGVLGITRSSQADLLARIDRLGTNLLTVANGRRSPVTRRNCQHTPPPALPVPTACSVSAPPPN